jgi:hypothetical protein
MDGLMKIKPEFPQEDTTDGILVNTDHSVGVKSIMTL